MQHCYQACYAFSVNIQDQHILVVGGAGFIGSHITEAFIRKNAAKVIVADNLSVGSRKNIEGLDTELYVCDCAEENTLADILCNNQINTVINLATRSLPYSLTFPQRAISETVSVVQNLCELQRKGKFETMIHFSSSEVYGSAEHTAMDESHPICPMTPYAAAKAASDHIVQSYQRTFGTQSYIIRPFNQFGPRQHCGEYSAVIARVIQALLSNTPITVTGSGNQSRDFLYVEDLAQAVIALLECTVASGTVVQVASGQEKTINDVIKTIATLMQYDPIVLFAENRKGDVYRHCASIKRAKELLLWEPSTSFEDGLQRTINWHTHEYSNNQAIHRGRRVCSNSRAAA